MKDSLTHLTLTTKLIATCCLIAFGIIVLDVTVGVTTERIKVNGPVLLASYGEKTDRRHTPAT